MEVRVYQNHRKSCYSVQTKSSDGKWRVTDHKKEICLRNPSVKYYELADKTKESGKKKQSYLAGMLSDSTKSDFVGLRAERIKFIQKKAKWVNAQNKTVDFNNVEYVILKNEETTAMINPDYILIYVEGKDQPLSLAYYDVALFLQENSDYTITRIWHNDCDLDCCVKAESLFRLLMELYPYGIDLRDALFIIDEIEGSRMTNTDYLIDVISDSHITESLEEFVEDLVNDTIFSAYSPNDVVVRYFDYEKFQRDLFISDYADVYLPYSRNFFIYSRYM